MSIVEISLLITVGILLIGHICHEKRIKEIEEEGDVKISGYITNGGRALTPEEALAEALRNSLNAQACEKTINALVEYLELELKHTPPTPGKIYFSKKEKEKSNVQSPI